MTTVNGTIAAMGAAQWVNLDPSTATKLLTLTNNSSDQIVFSWNGSPASLTNGVIVFHGAPLTFVPGPQYGGLTYPWGPLSVWGGRAGQAWAVSAI
jgi:hypothetical protein